jgi:hypothetical protein
MTAQNHASTRVESGYVPVNGLEIYYEVHGSGQPLVVLATCGIRRPELACENTSCCLLLLADSLEEGYN